MRRNGLTRAVCAALGVAAALALAGCGKPAAQAAAAPTTVSMATPAATAALPAGSYYGEAPASSAPAALAAAPQNALARATLSVTPADPPAAPADPPPPPPPPPQPQFARVVAVQPVAQSVTTSHPQRVCREEQVAVPVPYQDQHQVGGAVAGGLLGALAGHMIGGGHGKTLMTLAGAAGGAFAGHEIQKRHQEDNATQMEMRNVCHTVNDQTTSTHTVAYNVTYTIDGHAGHIRMARAPVVGTGLPVRHGVVVAPGALATR